MKRVLLAVAVAATLAGSALAQVQVAREPDKVVHRRTTVIDFDGIVVDGVGTEPAAAYVNTRTPAGFKNLIKVRENFNAEVLKSADSL